MDISSYLAEAGSAVRLAKEIGVAPALISQWRNSVRKVPAKRCPAIERATEGKVRCEDLRPDVDWAYLRGAGADHAVPESIAASTGEQPGFDCGSGDLRHKDRRKSEKRAQSDRRSTEQKAA